MLRLAAVLKFVIASASNALAECSFAPGRGLASRRACIEACARKPTA